MTCMAAWPIVQFNLAAIPTELQPQTLYMFRGYAIVLGIAGGYDVFDPQAEAAYSADEVAWGCTIKEAMAAVNELVDGERRRKSK